MRDLQATIISSVFICPLLGVVTTLTVKPFFILALVITWNDSLFYIALGRGSDRVGEEEIECRRGEMG